MRNINLIVIHCSATYDFMDVGVKEIRRWHRKRGFNDIGYHYVVRRDGAVEVGRDIEKVGAHAHGFNSNSIGVCWVGGMESGTDNTLDNRTIYQISSLQKIIKELIAIYPNATVLGHRDLKGVTKSCPSFNVRNEFKNTSI